MTLGLKPWASGGTAACRPAFSGWERWWIEERTCEKMVYEGYKGRGAMHGDEVRSGLFIDIITDHGSSLTMPVEASLS